LGEAAGFHDPEKRPQRLDPVHSFLPGMSVILAIPYSNSPA
jgi:hypothetical protein